MASSLEPLQLCTIARRAARAAAVVVREHAGPYQYTGTINAGGDRVLAVDIAADEAAQIAIAEAMDAARQPYALLSEESGLTQHGAAYPLFLLDPVDGSAQARRRHPDCAVSIAVALGPTLADLVAGVVQPIMGGEPYLAVRGRGARLGGHVLPLIPLPNGPATSLLLEGGNPTVLAQMAARFAAHDPDCQLHASGSIALQLALLAAGCYDALVACRPGSNAYDIAAGWLIVREAGSAYVDMRGLDSASASLTDSGVQHQPVAARTAQILEEVVAVAR